MAIRVNTETSAAAKTAAALKLTPSCRPDRSPNVLMIFLKVEPLFFMRDSSIANDVMKGQIESVLKLKR